MRPPISPQPSSQLWQTLSNLVLIRYVLLFSSGWITVLLINYFYGTIALFTAAGIFAALLNYPVVWLSRYIPRVWAITITFLVAIALLLGLVTGVGFQVLNQGQGLLGDLKNGLKQQDFLPFQDFLKQLTSAT